MKFMMLMIPAVYHGNKKLDPNFTPDPKMLEKMTKYNEELGKVFKITDVNGLHPAHHRRARELHKRKNQL